MDHHRGIGRRDPRGKDAGATAVEFALVAPLVVLLVVTALFGAFYYFYVAAASHVARAVARDASIPVHGVYPSGADEIDVAKQAAGPLLPAPTSVSVVPVTTVRAGNPVTVTVTYDLPLLAKIGSALPFLPHPGGTLTRTVTVRYE